jgi:uncharacterized protein
MTLNEFFEKNNRVAIAYSGGVDSSYLAYSALKAGAAFTAYYAGVAFQPEFERRDALDLADELGIPVKVIKVDVLAHDEITRNDPDRCYHCKNAMFGALIAAAKADGYEIILDGTNASDDEAGRPGMKALKELGALSPLRECGLTKEDIRRLSKEAGLRTWDKPSYSCLATRVRTGEPITRDTLAGIEAAEGFLRQEGYSDFRVRTASGGARLELTRSDLEKDNSSILLRLSELFDPVTIDPVPRGE